MGAYELIGFDMDGTILNSDKTISPRTLNAVGRAAAAGKTVILSTGRCVGELTDFADRLADVRYYVCESGALVYDSGEKRALHTELLPPDMVERVLAATASEDVMVYIMSGGWPYASRSDVARAAHFHMGAYRDMMNRVVRQTADIRAFYRTASMPVEKLNLFCASAKIRERLLARMRDWPVTAAFSEETSLELSPPGVSKASGLIWLCRHLDIPLKRTIIVGDADNDAEALRTAGLSVAMGNARPHIRQLCDVVVADNDHDGCAEAVDRYLLGTESVP